jgi:hypothetical protein
MTIAYRFLWRVFLAYLCMEAVHLAPAVVYAAQFKVKRGVTSMLIKL